jgi:ATP-binding protein involved in chromosome partitioning
MITKEKIIKALSQVQEPDLKEDLVTLNMIKNIDIHDKKIKVTVLLTTPACPLKELIKKNCVEAIQKEINDETYEILVELVADVTWGRTNDSEILPYVKNIIAIASGKGGVGKSTITSNLAVALTKLGSKVGLIDADIYGPSVPTMFDCESEKPKVEQSKNKNWLVPIERYGVKIISIGFLAPANSAVVWRGPMASTALRQFITDCKWEELDYLLVDLPPGTSDIHLTLVQTVPLTGAVIVTTPQKVAILDAQKALMMFKQSQINVPILGVIENMAYFVPEELPECKYYLFGKDGGKEMARSYNVPFLGQIPLVQSIRESGDKGLPIAFNEHSILADAFKNLAQNLAQQVAIHNAIKNKKVLTSQKF